MSSDETQSAGSGSRPDLEPRPVSPRAVLLALALLIPNVFFILHGYIWGLSRPTTVSLIFNVIVTLAILTALNAAIRRLRPALALTRGELLTIYTMLSVGSAVIGLDQLQTLLPVVAYPIWYATPENNWEQLFLQELPRWLTVSDPSALWAYYDSHAPLLATAYWRPWARVALIWSGFSITLVFVMLCLNTLLRRNWVEEAKLSYPIVQLPLEMTSPRRTIFADRLFWIAFALAFIVDALNGLHEIWPSVPSLLGSRGARYDLGQMIHSRPWNAVGWTPLNVYPFAVGLSYFIPTDLAFSMWFFYILWKGLKIFSSAVGWGDLPGAPWIKEQSFSAYLALAGFCLWASRRHLAEAVRAVIGGRDFDDAREPMPYSWALLGAVGGIAALIVFCQQAKMTLLPALGFILLYLLISVAIARIRAELGSPVHDLHFIGPQVMMTEVFGASALGKRNLIMFGFFHSITRAHRSHPMPHQIEGMKLAGESHTSQRGLTVAMMLAAAFALLLGWGVLLDAFFRYGGSGWSGKGREAWSLVDQWLTGPGTPNPYSWGALVWGMAFTMLLTWLRTRYVWWLLHPAGFAVSGSWSMALFAPSVLVGWLAKTLILHYGGMSAYAPASTFFMGLIMGEFTAGTGWGIAGIALQRRMYNFLP